MDVNDIDVRLLNKEVIDLESHFVDILRRLQDIAPFGFDFFCKSSS